MLFQHPVFISVPIPLLDGSAFIVLLLASRQRDLTFYLVAFPVKGNWYTGLAFLLSSPDQSGYFLSVK